MGPEHTSREKILSMVNFWSFVHKNVYRILDSKRSKTGIERVSRKSSFSHLDFCFQKSAQTESEEKVILDSKLLFVLLPQFCPSKTLFKQFCNFPTH